MIGRRLFLSVSLLLAGLAASPGFAQAPASARIPKVLILGIDGTRPDALQAAKAPNLKALANAGAYTYKSQTEDITISGPTWSSILTGVHHQKHGVKDNGFKGEQYREFPHLFRRLKQSNGKLKTASIVAWGPINYWIVSHCDYAVTRINDDAGVAKTGADLLRAQDPDVTFLHFDDVDHAGHGQGYGPEIPAYMAAIEKVDSQVGTVIEAVRARPTYAREDWLIIVTTDHGGKNKGHGPNEPIYRTTFMIFSGDSVKKGEITTPVSVVDIAPTALAHFGIVAKPEWGWDGHAVDLKPTK